MNKMQEAFDEWNNSLAWPLSGREWDIAFAGYQAAMTQERDQSIKNEAAIRTLMECYQLGGCTDHERLARNLAAAQAQVQQLRELITIVQMNDEGSPKCCEAWGKLSVVLDSKQDDTALRQQNAKLLRKMADAIYKGMPPNQSREMMRRKADELEGKK